MTGAREDWLDEEYYREQEFLEGMRVHAPLLYWAITHSPSKGEKACRY